MHTHTEPKLTTKNCTVTCETHPAVVTPKCTIRWKDRSKILPTVHTHTHLHISPGTIILSAQKPLSVEVLEAFKPCVCLTSIQQFGLKLSMTWIYQRDRGGLFKNRNVELGIWTNPAVCNLGH